MANLDLLSGVAYRDRILREIAFAKETVDLAMFHAGYYYKVLPDLMGKRVRVILNDHFQHKSDRHLAEIVRRKLSMVATVKFVRDLHCKMIIFDSRRVILGSANLTKKSLFYNKEVGIFCDAERFVKRCTDVFEELWSKGR